MCQPQKDIGAVSNAASYQDVVTWLEDDAAKRMGRPVREVRPILARQMGLAPGTLENVRKGRTKALRGWIERALDAALIKALKHQQARIENELAMAEARCVAADRGRLASLVATRTSLSELLAEAPN